MKKINHPQRIRNHFAKLYEERKRYKAFIIESNIPQPKENPKYPFHRMEKGDSFKFNKNLRKSVGINASHYQKATKTQFKVHKKENGLCRIWRTK